MLLPASSRFFSRYRRGDYLASASERGAVLFITAHRGAMADRYPECAECLLRGQEIARKKVSSVAVASIPSNRAAKRKLRMPRYRCAVPLLPCVRRRSRRSARARASNYSPGELAALGNIGLSLQKYPAGGRTGRSGGGGRRPVIDGSPRFFPADFPRRELLSPASPPPLSLSMAARARALKARN